MYLKMSKLKRPPFDPPSPRLRRTGKLRVAEEAAGSAVSGIRLDLERTEAKQTAGELAGDAVKCLL